MTMLARTGFKRTPYARAPRSALVPVTRGVRTACVDVARAHPKGEKARPGKRAPTIEETRWLDAIVRYGCIACRLDGMQPRPTAVHHIVDGGRRLGHLFSLGLCDPGHHQGGESLGLVSRHPWKARFEQRYGTEMDLLAFLRREIAEKQRKDGLF